MIFMPPMRPEGMGPWFHAIFAFGAFSGVGKKVGMFIDHVMRSDSGKVAS